VALLVIYRDRAVPHQKIINREVTGPVMAGASRSMPLPSRWWRLTAAERARREQVRLAAAKLIEAGPPHMAAMPASASQHAS